MPAPRPPEIVNVEELAKRKGGEVSLLHFTARQWKRAVQDIEFGPRTGLPKSGLLVTAIPHPDDVHIVAVHCQPSGPWDRCSVRAVPRPGGGIVMECRCRPGPDPTRPSGPIRVPSCRIALWPRFACENDNCSGRCVLRIWRDPAGGLLRLGCVCSNP